MNMCERHIQAPRARSIVDRRARVGRCVLASFIVVLLTSSRVVGAAPSETIRIRCQIFRVNGALSGDASGVDEIWAGDKPPGPDVRKTLTLFTEGRFKLAKDELRAERKGWTWNGTAIAWDGNQKAELPEDRISLIAPAPISVSASGQKAAIEINSDQKIQYFEKRDDGLFELKELDATTGLKIEMFVKAEKSGKIRLSDIVFQLRLVVERVAIPGVSLQVGRPVLKTKEYRVDLRLSPNEDCGILVHPGEGQGVLLVRLRAEREAPQNRKKRTSHSETKAPEALKMPEMPEAPKMPKRLSPRPPK